MSTLIFRYDGDGHKPRVSPIGDLVGWGDTSLNIVHVPNPSAIWRIGEGRYLRFLDNKRVTWVKILSNTTAKRYADDLTMFTGGIPQIDDVTLVGGNDFEASNGHWASVLISQKRLTYDGQKRGVSARAVRMCGEYMLTVETVDNIEYFVVYKNGTVERLHSLPPTANEFKISEKGWISFGYYGPTYIITPNGKIHQINVTKEESVARIVHTPDSVWAWTSTVTAEGQPLVLGRPLLLRGDVFSSDENCAQLPFPAEGVDAQWWDERQSFTVAGAANLGHTSPLEVHVVPISHPRSKVVSQAREPVLNTSGKKVNLWDFILPKPLYWPRTSKRSNGHDMNMVFDGRNLWTVPFGQPGHWIRWVIQEERGEQVMRHREDHSRDGQNTGDWSFTDAVWAKQWMSPRQFGGEVIDNSKNILVRYNPDTCAVVDVHRQPFKAFLYQHWDSYYCGPDLGWRPVIVLGHEAGDEIELQWFASDGASYFRFQVIDKNDHSRVKLETWFEDLNGPNVQPTPGCWKAEHLGLTPENWKGDGESGMTKEELLGININRDFVLGAWTRFINEEALGRDVIDGITREENLTDTVGTRGLVMYFFPAYYQAVMRAIDKMGHGPRNADEWGHVSVAGYEEAKRQYAEQKKPTNPNPGPGGGVDPGPSGNLTPLRVEGRYFANDNGLFDYREVSAFALFERFRQGQQDHCREFCRVLRVYGANAVRVILTLGGSYWEHVIGITSGPEKPGFTESLDQFARFMASEGFYVRFCLLGGLESFGGFSREREDVYSQAVHNKVVPYVHSVLGQLHDEPNVLFEIANEWNQIGMRDSDQRIIELGNLVKTLAPNRLMNLTNTNGPIADDPMWARRPADFVDAHLERWIGVGGFSWVKRSSESPVMDQTKMPAMSGEVVNLGSAQPGRPDDAVDSPAVAFAYGATSRLRRYLTNFHFHDGLAANIPDAVTQACMQGWQRGLNAIPFNFPGGWCNGHHSCSPWDINIFPREGEDEERHTRGPIRIFGLDGSQGYIGVSIAERAGAGVPAHRRNVQEVDRITHGGYSSAVYRA
jgi:hypothetical protein